MPQDTHAIIAALYGIVLLLFGAAYKIQTAAYDRRLEEQAKGLEAARADHKATAERLHDLEVRDASDGKDRDYLALRTAEVRAELRDLRQETAEKLGDIARNVEAIMTKTGTPRPMPAVRRPMRVSRPDG